MKTKTTKAVSKKTTTKQAVTNHQFKAPSIVVAPKKARVPKDKFEDLRDCMYMPQDEFEGFFEGHRKMLFLFSQNIWRNVETKDPKEEKWAEIYAFNYAQKPKYSFQHGPGDQVAGYFVRYEAHVYRCGDFMSYEYIVSRLRARESQRMEIVLEQRKKDARKAPKSKIDKP